MFGWQWSPKKDSIAGSPSDIDGNTFEESTDTGKDTEAGLVLADERGSWSAEADVRDEATLVCDKLLS